MNLEKIEKKIEKLYKEISELRYEFILAKENEKDSKEKKN